MSKDNPFDRRLATLTQNERINFAMLPTEFRMAVRAVWNAQPELAEREFAEWAREVAKARASRTVRLP